MSDFLGGLTDFQKGLILNTYLPFEERMRLAAREHNRVLRERAEDYEGLLEYRLDLLGIDVKEILKDEPML